MKEYDVLVIADTQVSNTSDTRHLESLARYIWKHKPGTIIHIGDHWDFESLSSYASVLESEGRRLVNDLAGGERALQLIMDYSRERNSKSKKASVYRPQLHFIKGNHENRLDRYIENNPVLEGLIDIDGFIEREGWEVHDFLKPLFIHDICFVHYLAAAQSGRPVGGSIENKLNKFPHSFVHGHQQQYQMGTRQNLLGKPHFGVCAGAFYIDDEGYRGANNTEKRGFVHLKAFTNRYGYLDHDVLFTSLERLMQEY
mgnify:CR=1 FL=1